MAGQFLVMAHRQGSYMKRMIVSFFIVLLFASHLAAQSSLRRRPAGMPSTVESRAYLDSRDPLSFFNTRPESNPAAKPSSANPVPVSQLRIPSKALKEFERARKAFQSGDIRISAEHLQKAVQIYPDFMEAHNALGLRFLQTGEYLKAVTEHQIALALDPRNAQTHQDLSLALLLLGRNQEAEAEARQALDLDPQPRSDWPRPLHSRSHPTAPPERTRFPQCQLGSRANSLHRRSHRASHCGPAALFASATRPSFR